MVLRLREQVTTRWVYALGALAAVLFGYDNGIISAAILFIPHDLALTSLSEGLVVSSTVVGAMVGALASGPAADRVGRQRLLLAAGIVFTIGALGAGAASTVAMLVAFRFVLGLGIGISSVMVPIYLAEMAPASDRGVITSLNQYMIIIGTAIAAGVGYALAFAGSWRWMMLIGVFPAIALMLGMTAMPDTPRSLVRRGFSEEARALLLRLRRSAAAAESEFAEITDLEARQSERAAGTSVRVRWVRRLLVLGAMLAIFQQITGINTIVYYAPSVLTSFGITKLTALLFTFLNGILNIITIALVVRAKVVDRWGRKPVLLCGLVGMSVSLFAVGIAAVLLPVKSTALFVIAIAGFVVFTNTFSATWGPVLWVVLAEIFPLRIRGTAMAVATLFNWLADFLVSLTFPTLTAIAGAGPVMIGYAAIGVIVFPVVWWAVPETKQHSLESLEEAFRSGSTVRVARPAESTASQP
jgi:sugar porter (SP) family MFS transporter